MISVTIRRQDLRWKFKSCTQFSFSAPHRHRISLLALFVNRISPHSPLIFTSKPLSTSVHLALFYGPLYSSCFCGKYCRSAYIGASRKCGCNISHMGRLCACLLVLAIRFEQAAMPLDELHEYMNRLCHFHPGF